MAERQEIFFFGRYLGNLLEALPSANRANAISEMDKLEQFYSSRHRDLPPLTLQLKVIDTVSLAPQGAIVRPLQVTYGSAIVDYLEAIPIRDRATALRQISEIISHFSLGSPAASR